MRRMWEFSILHEQGLVSKEKNDESISGWYAYAIHGNTYNMRKNIGGQQSIWALTIYVTAHKISFLNILLKIAYIVLANVV